MKPTKQLLATLLTFVMLLGLFPGAGAAELSAEYGETRYSDIASTTYSRMLMLKNNAFVAANEAGKYGLVSVTGEVKLPYEYDALYLTRDGVYLAEKDGKKLLIDAEGNVKINSANQIKLLETPGLYYADSKLYNPQGEVKLSGVDESWNWFPAVPAQNGILAVGNGKYYTEDGLQESNPFVWQGATPEGAEKLKGYDTANRMSHDWYDTSVDYFLVEKNNQRGVTNLAGNIVITLGDYTSIEALEDGKNVSFVVSAEAGKALFNAQGQKVVDFGTYSSIWADGYWDSNSRSVIWEGLFSVENTSGQNGKIDASGKVILPMGDYGWRLPGLNQKGFIAAKDGEAYKLYNKEGQLVKTFNHYVATEVYYRDLVFATTLETSYNTKYGAMNENGTTLVAAELDGLSLNSECWSPDNMLRATKEDSKVVLYDENYSPVYTDYKGIEYISEGRYLLYDGNYYGIGKNDGTFTVPVEYADIRIHNPEIIELYNGETYSLTNVDGDALVLPSTEESKLYGINPWAEFAPEWIDWAFSTNLDDTDYLKSAYDGYEDSVMPFLTKTENGTTTTYLNYHTGEIIGTLPVEASNILPSGEFVFKDATGKFGVGKLIQNLLPVAVTVTPPAGVTYGAALGDPAAQQQAISDGIDESATWAYLYEGTTRAGAAYSSASKPTQAGTYTVTATLVSETHVGSKKSAAFTIAPKALAADMITVTGTYTYTGVYITPSYTVADGSLLKSTDYTAEISDNMNAGDGKVTATATQTGNYTGSAEKTFVIAKAPIAALKPLVIGDAVVGKALSVNLDRIDLSGISWQWLREGQAIDNATGRSYLLTPADSNKDISVRAIASPDGNYTGTTLDGDALKVAKQAASGTVAVALSGSDDGTAKVGSTLTAAVDFQPSEAESGAAYQWYRGETAIEGAVNAAYVVTEADAGTVLKVVATAGADFTGTAQNAVTVGKKLLDGTLALVLTTDSNNNSEADIGDVLTATFTGDAATEDYTLVWLANKTVIEGATGTTYTVIATNQGKEISVSAKAKGDTYTGELLSNSVAVPAGVPAAPQITARAGDGTIYFAWTVPTDNGAPVLSYDLTFTDSDGTLELPGTARDVTMEGLSNGTAYTLTLVAKNSVGSSATGSATATPAAPYVPGPGGGTSGSGTVTEKNPDGSTTTTATDKKTGAVTETTKHPDGTVQTVVTQKDGSMTATETRKDGTKVECATTSEGKTTATIVVPEKADKVTVTIPTPAKPKAGEVAVIIKADGTREVVKTSVATENGLKVALSEGAKLEIVDNSKTFADVPTDHWGADAITFVTSRELFNGGNGGFVPASDMSRAMLFTVLARLDGQDTIGGDKWYSSAMNWAKESGISDGTNPDASITRESLAVMLYRYAGSPEVGGMAMGEFGDSADISGWASDAMLWCVENGILNGSGGKLNPAATATRAEVAAMLQRFISASVK